MRRVVQSHAATDTWSVAAAPWSSTVGQHHRRHSPLPMFACVQGQLLNWCGHTALAVTMRGLVAMMIGSAHGRTWKHLSGLPSAFGFPSVVPQAQDAAHGQSACTTLTVPGAKEPGIKGKGSTPGHTLILATAFMGIPSFARTSSQLQRTTVLRLEQRTQKVICSVGPCTPPLVLRVHSPASTSVALLAS